MDAISFVLGIKSSHLRSTHLKDLIYRGRVMKTAVINEDGSAAAPATNGHSDSYQNGEVDESHRSSRNDPKTAWVMAVYEDDAGDEHKWKRSITSQGSSEYRINNHVVTAQQYNDALEAENILIKARNFLVFQGDVEAIAAQSSQDLTRLIEQISGSLEYKPEYEKLKAEEEQAQENQNFQLTRRRGINSEIKQYQEQKKEAENFQKKMNERDAAIVTHNLWKLYHFQRVMDESIDEIQEHQENLKEFHRNLEAFERKLEMARKDQGTIGRDVGKLEKAIKQKERGIEDQKSLLVPIDEKVEQISREVNKLKNVIDNVIKERDEEQVKIKKAEKDLALLAKAQQQFEDQWHETLKKKGSELSEADQKELDALRSQVLAKTADNQANLRKLRLQLKADEATVSTLKGNMDRNQALAAKLQTELATIKDRRDSKAEQVQQLTGDLDTKKKELKHLKSERIRVNNARTEIDEKLRDVLVQREAATAGLAQGHKERRAREMISNMKRNYQGVHGKIGDLCQPKQKKYDEAIITALGHNFDSVVVDTEKIAAECIQYLREQRHGAMTFIPLDNIKVNATNSAVKNIPGARLTIDTIDFKSEVERAIAYACESSVICDSWDIARDISFRRRIPVKTVTLEGKVIHKSGLMTAGRVPEHKGSKRKFAEGDVENLEKMAAAHRDAMARLPDIYQLVGQEKVLEDELANLEQNLRIARVDLQAFEKNAKSKQKEAEHAKAQLKQLEPTYAERATGLDKTRASVAKFEKAIAQVEDKVFAGFCQKHGFENIREYDAQQGSLEREAGEKRSEFAQQRSRLNMTHSWQRSRYEETKARAKRIEDQLRRLEADVQGHRREKADIEESMGQRQDEVEALKDNLTSIKATHTERADRVAEARAEVQRRNKEIESRQKEINALETEVQKNSASKFAVMRRCKLEQIQIPIAKGSLDDLPNEDTLFAQDPDAMDVDGAGNDVLEAAAEGYGIEIDYDGLDEDLKDVSDPFPGSRFRVGIVPTDLFQPEEANVEDRLESKIAELTAELEKLNPNMRAIERLETVENRLRNTEQDFHDSRAALKRAKDSFDEVKKKRFDLFNRAFLHIQEQISHVYKELTRTDAYPLGGQAYLDIEEDNDQPYLSGIKYHAMPPLKRFRDMEHLSGGEKTMAAMALLFAIHSYQPSPFFVLDEIDAALDNANVEKIKKYIREHAGPGMQFVVISLKTGLFQDSESLVGVYRDQEANSSRTLTLDVRTRLPFPSAALLRSGGSC